MGWTDLFITVKEDDKNKDTKNVTKPNVSSQTNTTSVSAQPSYTPAAPTSTSTPGGIDQNLIQKLQNIFDKTNMPGPDLHEFITTLKKYDNKPLDEKTKYELVFDAQSSVGLTKQRLIESGKFYIDTFSDVKSEFEKEYQSELQKSVTNLTAEADGVISENANLQKNIEELNKKIQDNLTRMQKLKTDASVNENRLMQEKLSFETTFSFFVGNVQKYIDGVNLHIQ